MSSLLAIDPGNRSGFAMFVGGDGVSWKLAHACVARPDDVDVYEVPDIVVIEFPARTYAGKSEKSILKLAGTAGRYIERYRCAGRTVLVEPREWKGTIDGDSMSQRIKDALSVDEHRIAAAAKYDHNMLDAIGMGKWALRQPWVRVVG